REDPRRANAVGPRRCRADDRRAPNHTDGLPLQWEVIAHRSPGRPKAAGSLNVRVKVVSAWIRQRQDDRNLIASLSVMDSRPAITPELRAESVIASVRGMAIAALVTPESRTHHRCTNPTRFHAFRDRAIVHTFHRIVAHDSERRLS